MALKKVKTAIENVQSTKVKKVAIVQDNSKRNLATKTRHKKRKLNEMLNISMATKQDEGLE